MSSTSSTEMRARPAFSAFRKILLWLEKRLTKAGVSRIELRIDSETHIMAGQLKAGIPVPSLHIHNPLSLARQSSQGLLGWSEAFLDGDWSSPDLKALIDWAMFNEENLEQEISEGWFSRLIRKVRHKMNDNSRKGSRRNISAHYDLGNDFYQHWLDPTMTYSSALYLDDQDDLETAQKNKYNTIIDWLDLREGQSVLEIGCGWGGFANALRQRHGGDYHGITLSKEQLAFARQTNKMLSPDAFSLTDYRDIKNEYDHIVSIEMIEAVGERHWPVYFQKIFNSLKPGGSVVIQVILIDDSRFEGYRNNVDFIQRYIFPGGMLPCDKAMKEQAHNAGLSISNRLSFGLDYAKTLAEWKNRFFAAWPAIEQLGFDERFKRLWHFYLAYCETGFQFKSIDVCLYKLTKPREVLC